MRDFLEDSIELKFLVVAIVGLISIEIVVSFFSSCLSASIYNTLNNTNYTCSDFFWASDQINTRTQTLKLK